MGNIIYFDNDARPHEAQEVQHNADDTINVIFKRGEFKRNFVFDNSEEYGEANRLPMKSSSTVNEFGQAVNCYKVV